MKKKNIKINYKGRSLTRDQQKMVEQCMDIADQVARQERNMGFKKGLSLDDLKQEGYWALCLAALDFKGADVASFRVRATEICQEVVNEAITHEERLDEDVDLFTEAESMTNIPAETEDERRENIQLRMTRSLQVEERLDVLDKRERKVICMVYGINCCVHDYQEIAQKIGLKRKQVREIYETAMGKMEFKTPSNSPIMGRTPSGL